MSNYCGGQLVLRWIGQKVIQLQQQQLIKHIHDQEIWVTEPQQNEQTSKPEITNEDNASAKCRIPQSTEISYDQ